MINQPIDLGHGVQVTVGQTRSNWCTVSLTLLEGDSFDRNPRRALLVATGITENTNMGWQDEARSTVGRDWGKPPSLVEPIAATVQIPRGAALPVLYPLDDRGQRGQGIPATAAGAERGAVQDRPAARNDLVRDRLRGVGTEIDYPNDQQVPILSGFLGLDWRPPSRPNLDILLGSTAEYWWNVGRLSDPDIYNGDSAGEMGAYGVSLRLEYNF